MAPQWPFEPTRWVPARPSAVSGPSAAEPARPEPSRRAGSGLETDVPWVIAHRAATSSSRRSASRRLEDAIVRGADMAEVDVRRTRDGVFVAHHDSRLGGRRIRHRRFRDLQRLAHRGGVSVPRLEPILAQAQGRVRLDLELKEPGGEDALVRLLRRYLREDALVVTSFWARSLGAVKDAWPEVRVGLLRPPTAQRPMRRRRRRDPHPWPGDFLALHHRLWQSRWAERLVDDATPVVVWTVNGAWGLRRCLRHPQVAGVITDRPARACRIRRRLAHRQTRDQPAS